MTIEHTPASLEATVHPPLANFTRMQEGTEADWRVIGADFVRFTTKLPDRVLAHLRLLDGDYGGFPVDRLKHSLQTATRAAKVAMVGAMGPDLSPHPPARITPIRPTMPMAASRLPAT